MAIGFERTRFKIATEMLGADSDSRAIGHALGLHLYAEDLTAVFILSDGLNINGSALVAGVSESVGRKAAITGGLACDGASFGHTFVHANGSSRSHIVAATGFYGSAIRIAHGYAGGWDVFGLNRIITRSQGNVLIELYGKPALDLYERHLGDEAADLPASGLLYPLQIWSPDQPEREVVRTVLAIDRESRSRTLQATCRMAGKRG